MAITITEILGNDSISGSRFTINANFKSLKNEFESFENTFNISLTAGNLDVSGATGGSIKGKTGAFNSLSLPATGTPGITLTGSSGAIVSKTLNASTSIQTPSLTISTGGNILNQGSSQFDGTSVFNEFVVFNEGIAYGSIDVGFITSHTVLNSNRVVIFDSVTSPGALSLVADASLVNGHVVTFVYKGTGSCSLDITNVLGFSTGSIMFSPDAYKSAISLMYNLASGKWIIVNSTNMTIV